MDLPSCTLEALSKQALICQPEEHLPEGWSGNALEILQMEDIEPAYRLDMVLHPSRLPEAILRKFAIWCARQALRLVRKPDPRAVAACEMAECYLKGTASAGELAEYEADAWDAAKAAAVNYASVISPLNTHHWACAASAAAAAQGGAWEANMHAALAIKSAPTGEMSDASAAFVAHLIQMLSEYEENIND